MITAAMMVQTGMSDLVATGGVESVSNVEHYSTELRRGARWRDDDHAADDAEALDRL